ncbi:MAG: hypothetical protein GY833_07150, partial [Aestuariibacter sp.]|nr:hypothetical protein [Aestuariibacter sp.]
MRYRILLVTIALLGLVSLACDVNIKSSPAPFPTPVLTHPTASLPICPDLPRPAMLFQLDSDGVEYVLHHPNSDSECTLQFNPSVSQILALTASGVYYTTVVTSNNVTTGQVLHYANDGTITLLPYVNVTDWFYFLVTPDGSRVAWSRAEVTITSEGDEVFVNELYSANVDGSEMRMLYSQSNVIEAEGMRIVQPLRFADDGNLLFAIQLIGKGGRWDAYTGRYSNLYRVPINGGDTILLYECAVDNRGDCIGDISTDNAYFAVTDRNAGEVVIYSLEGSLIATYSGRGQEHIGHPNFSPNGDLVFMSADVKDDGSIEQGYISYTRSPYEETALPLFT